jgi:deferrochelatase/peroxidase EfeB
LQDDTGQALKAVRRLTEQAQDLMVVVRNEAGAFAQTSRRVRRKLVRGVDRVEERLTDLETLYDLVHGEVEDAALDVAATLRSVRRGNGMLGRVRRMLVAGRS